MARVRLNDHFYEDEVREGFYVPAAIKQAWGAQIQVFNEIDTVCEKLGIKYFACSGTFLGTVRHGGFIPWDDDLDLCMLRDDYNRFLEEGIPLLPEGYAIYNFHTKEDHTSFNFNVVAKNRICFEPEHLEKFHGFPYIASVDLFILDYMSNNDDEQYLMRTKAQYIIKTSDDIRDGLLTDIERNKQFRFLEEKLGIKVPEGLTDSRTRQFLDIKADELFGSFVDQKNTAKNIVFMMPFGIKGMLPEPSRFYSRQVYLPFESGSIPVPVIYNGALRMLHRNFMAIYKGTACHDYPFFLKSRQQLQEVLDFDLPEYRVDADELIKQHNERTCIVSNNTAKPDTYNAVVSECLSEMELLANSLSQSQSNDVNSDLCVKLQQLAIDLGSYMEAAKGEGYDIVAILEEYCESLYRLAQSTSAEYFALCLSRIKSIFNTLSSKVKSRKEVLFLPFNGEYWYSLASEYKKHLVDPDTDVFVMPIPYYYKDYLGRLRDMQFDTSKYPHDLTLTNYNTYDIALHHPDIIYTQYPYDSYNPITSIHPDYYSDRLRLHTDKLVYIPWFRINDFTRENGPEYTNMNYYCTVPGVINADLIILQSETLKNTYIEKLCDFAGEETRQLWEGKIRTEDICPEGNSIIRDSSEIISTSESNYDRTLLYYADFSEILEFEDTAISKILDTIQVFLNAPASWSFIILKGKLIDEVMPEVNRELYDKYIKAIKSLPDNSRIKLVNENETSHEALVRTCDVFYGDGGWLAHKFRNAGRPVKLQDYHSMDLPNVDSIYASADFNRV